MRFHRLRGWPSRSRSALSVPGIARADWVVQVAAYTEREHVAEGAARLKKAGFPVATEEFTPKVGRPLTRLLVGPYLDRKAADAIAARLKAQGWPGYVRPYAAAAPPPAVVAAASARTAPPPAPAPAPHRRRKRLLRPP